MKPQFLLSVLLAFAVAASAQPADTATKLTNDLPFPLVAPAKAQQLALAEPIVIALDEATLGAALDELQKQSGVSFGTRQAGVPLDSKISVKINTLSFDEAFDQIMKAANVKATLQNWGDDNLQLSLGGDETARNRRKSGAGLFEIELSGIGTTLNKSVDLNDFDKPQRSQNLNLNAYLALQADRRLPIIGAPQTRLTRAEDEQGRSLVPQLDENQRAQNRVNRYNFYGNSAWERQNATVNLAAPAPDAKTLTHLEGVVIYAVVTKTDNWEVPDLLAAPQWTHTFASPDGTVAVTIAATPNADEDQAGGLKLKIEATSSNADQSYERIPYPLEQVEPLIQAIRIVDANGTVYRSNGYNATGGQNTKISLSLRPENSDVTEEAAQPKLQSPISLVMDAPVEVVQTEVPFAFQNVPLP